MLKGNKTVEMNNNVYVISIMKCEQIFFECNHTYNCV
jgi:hypothetical protein